MKASTGLSLKIKKSLRVFGPGLITGASDDDPSGIATYSQAGARFGYSTLWTAILTFPLMAAIQGMCGRIGARNPTRSCRNFETLLSKMVFVCHSN
ncbi:MAG TPA: divalent metal cation transporter, partial [Cyclobacteriaceae bacterium]|nr:divalent metal cation transporter [Cyclobacteriaceae bacterium]